MPPGGTKPQPGPHQNWIKQLDSCNFRQARNNTTLLFCVINFFELHLSPYDGVFLTPLSPFTYHQPDNHTEHSEIGFRFRSRFNTFISYYILK